MSVPLPNAQYRGWQYPAPVDPAKVALLDVEVLNLQPAVGKPAASTVVATFVVPFACTLPANCVGSVAKALTGATTSTTFTVKQNAVAIFTLNFAAAGQGGIQAATFSTQAAVTLAAGDILELDSPAQDATLANVSVNLYAQPF